jgi:hypothetical protein
VQAKKVEALEKKRRVGVSESSPPVAPSKYQKNSVQVPSLSNQELGKDDGENES